LAFNSDVANSLELLLESLIKMVGKANQKIDHLQKRIVQLEWQLREQQLLNKENSPRNLIIHPTSKASARKSLHS
jgi:hypothetical protein